MGSAVPVTDSAMAEFDKEKSAAIVDGTDAETTEEKKEPRKRGRKKVRETLDNLIPDNTDRIKGKITEFLKLRSSGNDLAMLHLYIPRCPVGTLSRTQVCRTARSAESPSAAHHSHDGRQAYD